MRILSSGRRFVLGFVEFALGSLRCLVRVVLCHIPMYTGVGVIVALGNQKGGVGKSTTAFNLGWELAKRGRRVLMVDIDPQSSLTLAAGIESAAGHSIAEVMGDGHPGTLAAADAIVSLGDGLDLLPSDIQLASNEMGMIQRPYRIEILSEALTPVVGAYDHIVLDLPPNLGTLTVNGLKAAERVLIPSIPDYLSVRGLRLFLDTVQNVRTRSRHPDLIVLGVLLTFHDGRLLHVRDIVEVLESRGVPLMPMQIPRSVRIAESALAHLPMSDYDPMHVASRAYAELAEVIDNA